jgi:hypothetical protein
VRWMSAFALVLVASCGGVTHPQATAPTTTTSAAARPLDGNVVARDFAAIGMRFKPNSRAHRVSEATAIRAAEVDQRLSQYRANVRVVLGTWTNAVARPTPQETLALADDRLVWLVRFTGLSLPSSGPGPVQVNHELNVMVDANTGHVVGSVTYR